VPHGFEVSFRAHVRDDVPLGTYTSQLTGSALGTTASLAQAAQVRVVAHMEQTYLPMMVGATQNGGVWYSQVPLESLPASPEDNADADSQGDGAIIPTHFLHGPANLLESGHQAIQGVYLFLDTGEPQVLAVDGRWGRAYVGLAGGGLAVLNLETLEVEKYISLDSDLITLTPGSRVGTAYGVLETGVVVLIDTAGGDIIARFGDLGRPRALVFDPQTDSLLVADAAQGAIIRLRSDLTARLATHRLDAEPDQMLLDRTGRRLYVMLPGARRVISLDADTLRPGADTELVGGPLIDMTLDAARGRLYILSALSPRYRGISVLKTGDLFSLALVAGSPDIPLRQATALTLSSNGHLLVVEGSQLYRISPDDFALVDGSQLELKQPLGRGGLVTDPGSGHTLWLAPAGVFMEREATSP
jgi:hypothetical protein